MILKKFLISYTNYFLWKLSLTFSAWWRGTLLYDEVYNWARIWWSHWSYYTIGEELKIPVASFWKVIISLGFQNSFPFHFQMNWKGMENIKLEDKSLGLLELF